MIFKILLVSLIFTGYGFCAEEGNPEIKGKELTEKDFFKKEVLCASLSDESSIGRGAYGQVFAVPCSKINIAVKISSGSDYSSSCNEASILRELQHNNIIKFEYFFTFSDNCYLCLELMECDLHFLLNTERALEKAKRQFTRDHIVLAMLQIFEGLDYLQSQRVVHGDIKPRNIFLNGSPLRFVIGDFGDSFRLKEGVEFRSIEEGEILPMTLWYRCWEILKRNESGYSHPCDIWASGCVFWEILTLSPLFPGRHVSVEETDDLREQLAKDDLSNQNQIAIIEKNLPKIYPSKFIEEWQRKCVELILEMLAKDPSKRISTKASIERLEALFS